MCVVTLTMSPQLVKFLSASRRVRYNAMKKTCSPSELFKQVNSSFLIPLFPDLLLQWNNLLPFTSDLIRPVTFALLGRTPDESLLHLVLCCWLHLPTGIAPTHARLCPSAIHSDFVQLVNLASPPCWELRQRKREEEGVRSRRWRRRGKSEICIVFFLSSLTGREEKPLDKVEDLTDPALIGEPSHTSSYTLSSWMCLIFSRSSHIRLEHQ